MTWNSVLESTPMIAPWTAARKVEESKVVAQGDVRPHHLVPLGVESHRMEGEVDLVAFLCARTSDRGTDHEAGRGVMAGRRTRLRRRTMLPRGAQHERSRQASGRAGEAGRRASRLLESMENVRREAESLWAAKGQGQGSAESRSAEVSAGAGGPGRAASSVKDILAEWDGLSWPGPEGGIWTQEQSGASPEQAMTLAEEGVGHFDGGGQASGPPS
ncbi:hypothetical protein CYMTET_52201 [Cymbomonas tetramitiformis]|uniref:Uncharacterized protein n=1 Tax=Cymbomonas tetramitiformis TaxID=36881 RepID=A0AAE0BLB9_9CHLO|nr:hypothetical protein CYMTET_52201 [Cymbomonas tetramitiformis]